jgi:hypothetical protein
VLAWACCWRLQQQLLLLLLLVVQRWHGAPQTLLPRVLAWAVPQAR